MVSGDDFRSTGFSNFRNFPCGLVLNGVEMEWKIWANLVAMRNALASGATNSPRMLAIRAQRLETRTCLHEGEKQPSRFPEVRASLAKLQA